MNCISSSNLRSLLLPHTPSVSYHPSRAGQRGHVPKQLGGAACARLRALAAVRTSAGWRRGGSGSGSSAAAAAGGRVGGSLPPGRRHRGSLPPGRRHRRRCRHRCRSAAFQCGRRGCAWRGHYRLRGGRARGPAGDGRSGRDVAARRGRWAQPAGRGQLQLCVLTGHKGAGGCVSPCGMGMGLVCECERANVLV